MGMLDKLRDFLMISNDDQYDDQYDDEEQEYIPPQREEREVKNKAMYEEQDKSKVVNFNAASGDKQDRFSVVLVKPKAYREGDAIADHLNAKKTVILNLEDASQTDSIRLVDFLSGAAYAIGGKIEKINADIYIVAPYNVEFSGNMVEELANGILL